VGHPASFRSFERTDYDADLETVRSGHGQEGEHPGSQCPHWGYVFKGKMTARYADHDEVFEAGDAFYTPPGHIPVQNEPGTEFVWFSPSEEPRTAEAAMIKNMQSMQDGATP
jgi:uncharacterized RmlC-like cupin family protein